MISPAEGERVGMAGQTNLSKYPELYIAHNFIRSLRFVFPF